VGRGRIIGPAVLLKLYSKRTKKDRADKNKRRKDRQEVHIQG
jgi:hypothetical protein